MCGVSSLTERGRVDCVQSCLDQMVLSCLFFFIACSDKNLCEGAGKEEEGGREGLGGSSNVSRTLC